MKEEHRRHAFCYGQPFRNGCFELAHLLLEALDIMPICKYSTNYFTKLFDFNKILGILAHKDLYRWSRREDDNKCEYNFIIAHLIRVNQLPIPLCQKHISERCMKVILI